MLVFYRNLYELALRYHEMKRERAELKLIELELEMGTVRKRVNGGVKDEGEAVVLRMQSP
jgi:hypothetical protein